MPERFEGPNANLYSFEAYCEGHEDGGAFAEGLGSAPYFRWVVAMLPHRKEIAFYDIKNHYYALALAAGRGEAMAVNIAVEMAFREVGWMPDDEWAVHRLRPPLRSVHLRGFADGVEPKDVVAAGRPSKYPWDRLAEVGGHFTLSPGPGMPKVGTIRVLLSRKRKLTGWQISCKRRDDGGVDIERVG